MIRLAHPFCCSLPIVYMISANSGPDRYMKIDGLAPTRNSLIAHVTSRGAATPPTSGSTPTRPQPASCHARTDATYSGGNVTSCVAGSNVGGFRSATENDAATGPSASAAASRSIVRTVSPSSSVRSSASRISSRPNRSNRTNSRSRGLLR